MQLPSSDQHEGSLGPATCPDESTMLAFVEGRLGPAERSQIDVHLSTCSECRQLVSALAQGGLVLGDTRSFANATPVATAVLDASPLFAGAQRPSGAPPVHSPSPSTSPLLRPGDRVADRYVVERAIGSGGMGIVVAAKHLGLGRVFAIKLLDPRYAGSTDATNRFLREARASAQLRGEHVVQVTDMGETMLPDRTKAPFLVMELLDGTDLSKTTNAKKPIASLEAVWIILQACEALAEAHHVGIVHRDIKPANLIVTRKVDGTPHLKVVDFGISKAHDIARSLGSLTSQNVVMGTPRYMAPEQMRSSKDVDGRADVWALGAVLYELLSGTPAFDAPSMTELITRVQLEEPVSLTAAAPHISAGLADVVHRCLRKNPEERIASVADLADALAPYAPAAALHHVERTKRSFLGGRPSIVPSAPPVPRALGSATPSKAPAREEHRLGTAGIAALSLGALLLGIATTAGVLLLRQPVGATSPAASSGTAAPPTLAPEAPLTLPTAATPVFAAPTLSPTVAKSAQAVQGVASHAAVAPVRTSPHVEPPLPTTNAVAPPPQPSAPPEDPHSLRQRQ